MGGYAPPPGYQNPADSYGTPRPENLYDAHREVYKEKKAHVSHEIIAGAAAFEVYNMSFDLPQQVPDLTFSFKAVRAYARHQQNEGKPIAHPHAKEAIAAIASAEVRELT